MDIVGLALRLWIVIFGVTFFLLQTFTYFFHGEYNLINLADLSTSITGLFASSICGQLNFNLFNKTKNNKHFFILIASIFGIIYYIYNIISKVMLNG